MIRLTDMIWVTDLWLTAIYRVVSLGPGYDTLTANPPVNP